LKLYHYRNVGLLCKEDLDTTGNGAKARIMSSLKSKNAKTAILKYRMQIRVNGTQEEMDLAEVWWKAPIREVLSARAEEDKTKRDQGAKVCNIYNNNQTRVRVKSQEETRSMPRSQWSIV
jgi:hypothetical protein